MNSGSPPDHRQSFCGASPRSAYTYLTGQAFRYDQRAKGFVVVGGEAYNYDRRLDNQAQPPEDT